MKSSINAPAVDKEKEAIDIAREKNWEAVKRKHEAASKKEEAEATIGKSNVILHFNHLIYSYAMFCLNHA